jgi:hypothetical protein
LFCKPKINIMSQNHVSGNKQDHPHQEGNYNNTASQDANGRAGKTNNNQGMDDMLQESEEQKAGRAHGQKDEGSVKQGERLP